MDASYKIQRGIHVHLIQFFMCPEFWVHISLAAPLFFADQQKIPCFCRSCRIAAGIPQISLAESGHIQYNIKVRNFRFLANLAPEYLRGLKHT